MQAIIVIIAIRKDNEMAPNLIQPNISLCRNSLACTNFEFSLRVFIQSRTCSTSCDAVDVSSVQNTKNTKANISVHIFENGVQSLHCLRSANLRKTSEDIDLDNFQKLNQRKMQVQSFANTLQPSKSRPLLVPWQLNFNPGDLSRCQTCYHFLHTYKKPILKHIHQVYHFAAPTDTRVDCIERDKA